MSFNNFDDLKALWSERVSRDSAVFDTSLTFEEKETIDYTITSDKNDDDDDDKSQEQSEQDSTEKVVQKVKRHRRRKKKQKAKDIENKCDEAFPVATDAEDDGSNENHNDERSLIAEDETKSENDKSIGHDSDSNTKTNDDEIQSISASDELEVEDQDFEVNSSEESDQEEINTSEIEESKLERSSKQLLQDNPSDDDDNTNYDNDNDDFNPDFNETENNHEQVFESNENSDENLEGKYSKSLFDSQSQTIQKEEVTVNEEETEISEVNKQSGESDNETLEQIFPEDTEITFESPFNRTFRTIRKNSSRKLKRTNLEVEHNSEEQEIIIDASETELPNLRTNNSSNDDDIIEIINNRNYEDGQPHEVAGQYGENTREHESDENISDSEDRYAFYFNDPLEILNEVLIKSNVTFRNPNMLSGDFSELEQATNEEIIKKHNSTFSDGIMSKSPEVSDDEEKKMSSVEETSPNFDLHQINIRALPKHADTYRLESFQKNALIIFNQENIDGYRPRLGTDRDVEELTKTFSAFGFEVEEHKDLCRDEIFSALKLFTETDFTDYGCIAVAVLTHGSDMGSLRARDRRFYENDIINYFKTHNKPTLVTKPKILIIQACRGTKITQAVYTTRRVSKIRTDRDQIDHDQSYTLPIEADMLILHSTYAGMISHRDELHGTWFIQTLCRKINELAPHTDFESIITEVKKSVAIDKEHEDLNRRTFEMDTNKQMPVMTSTLIRKLYLIKYNGCDDYEPSNDEFRDNIVTDSNADYFNTKGVCDCYLDRFVYLRNCIRYFVDDNPEDEVAKSFLDVAETFDDSKGFDAAKLRISKAISDHLSKYASDSDYYKYLYFIKD